MRSLRNIEKIKNMFLTSKTLSNGTNSDVVARHCKHHNTVISIFK
jgi:hypothetical protein